MILQPLFFLLNIQFSSRMETHYIFTVGKCTVCALVIFYTLELAIYLCSAFMASPFAHILTLLLAIWIYTMGDRPERSDSKPTEAAGSTDLPGAEPVTTVTNESEQQDEPIETSDIDGSDNELQVSLSDEDE